MKRSNQILKGGKKPVIVHLKSPSTAVFWLIMCGSVVCTRPRPSFKSKLESNVPLYTKRHTTEKVKNYHLIHVVLHVLHIMAVNVSAIIRVTPQTRVYT